MKSKEDRIKYMQDIIASLILKNLELSQKLEKVQPKAILSPISELILMS